MNRGLWNIKIDQVHLIKMRMTRIIYRSKRIFQWTSMFWTYYTSTENSLFTRRLYITCLIFATIDLHCKLNYLRAHSSSIFLPPAQWIIFSRWLKYLIGYFAEIDTKKLNWSCLVVPNWGNNCRFGYGQNKIDGGRKW